MGEDRKKKKNHTSVSVVRKLKKSETSCLLPSLDIRISAAAAVVLYNLTARNNCRPSLSNGMLLLSHRRREMSWKPTPFNYPSNASCAQQMLGCGAGSRAAGLPDATHRGRQDLNLLSLSLSLSLERVTAPHIPSYQCSASSRPHGL